MIIRFFARHSRQALLFASIIAPMPAMAQTANPPADQPIRQSGDLWHRDRLLGSAGGLRPRLAEDGITVQLSDAETVFGNPTGGTRRSLAYQGLIRMGLKLDTDKAFGWQGGKFHVSALQIHGAGLGTLSLNNINTITGIEDPAQTSLYELWYDQKLGHGMVDLRIGRQSAGREFMISAHEDSFINSAFGWPTLTAEDLPAGGPDYPYAFTGIRLALHPNKDVIWRTGVYDSNFAGNGFSLASGVFAISELDLSHGQGKHPRFLPGSVRLGAWYDSNAFTDQRVSADGVSLADPANRQPPLRHRGNAGVYFGGGQTLYRGKPRQIGIVGRVMVAPGDRNLVDLYADAGMALTGMLPGRQNDIIVAGIGYAKISHAKQVFDINVARYTHAPYPIASAETFIELGYAAKITPWWRVQPDFQYVFNPGGGIPDPQRDNRKIADAAVFGVQSLVKF
jgi:porin